MAKLYKIKIGFSRPKSNWKIGSLLIRWTNKTEYSHVYIQMESQTFNRTLIYESTGHGGVNFVNYNLWKSRSIVILEKELTLSSEQYARLLTFCFDYAGQPYAFKQILNISYNYFRKIIGLKPISWRDSDDSMICSELLARLLCDVLSIKPIKDFNLYEPKDIEDLLVSFNNSL